MARLFELDRLISTPSRESLLSKGIEIFFEKAFGFKYVWKHFGIIVAW
jgi:hypothetical protein